MEARPQSRWERVARRLAKERWKLAVVAAFVLLAGVAGWFKYQQDASEHDKNVLAYEPAVLESVTKIFTGNFTLPAVTGKRLSLTSYGDVAVSPVGREDLRELLTDESGSVADAEEQLLKQARALRDRHDAPYHLARAYRLLGRPKEAKTAIEVTLDRARDFAPAKVLQWELAGQPGGLDGKEFREIESEYEDTAGWQSLWLRAYASMGRKKWKKAI